jgi:hypothetical protein
VEIVNAGQSNKAGAPTMSDVITIIAVVAIIAFVIGRQLMGEPLRGKRVVLLPVILTVIGLSDLGSKSQPVTPTDIAFLVVGGLLAAGIGAAQGSVMRLESRDGALWGQMPLTGLWLWALLIGTRLLVTGVADVAGAHVAGSTSTILLMLGINRLAQAAVVLPRTLSANIPFAPEKDGKTFLAGLSGAAAADAPAQRVPVRAVRQRGQVDPTRPERSAPGIDWPAVGRQVSAFLDSRRDSRRDDRRRRR